MSQPGAGRPRTRRRLSPPISPRLIELTDERVLATDEALALIEGTFDRRDRQPIEELRSEVAEKRLRLTTAEEFHLFAAVGADDAVLAAVTGTYLDGVNAGFVTYLAVRQDMRRHGIGRKLRSRLVERFRVDARLSQASMSLPGCSVKCGCPVRG